MTVLDVEEEEEELDEDAEDETEAEEKVEQKGMEGEVGIDPQIHGPITDAICHAMRAW